MAGRRRLPWILLAAFVVVPLVEIFVLIQVGQVIGPWWTIAVLVADSLLGTWLIRREGGRAWGGLRTALDSGRMPATELADGALILIGGTLMLTPGFVTDALGILLILPFTRPVFRRALAKVVARRLTVAGPVGGLGGFGGLGGLGGTGASAPGAPGTGRRPGAGPRDAARPGPVVRGEVVED